MVLNDRPTDDSPPPIYVASYTIALPAHDGNDRVSESSRRPHPPIPYVSSVDMACEALLRHAVDTEGKFIKRPKGRRRSRHPRPYQWPRPTRLPAPPGRSEDPAQRAPHPYQQVEICKSIPDAEDSSHLSQPAVPTLENPSDLEAGQDFSKEDEPKDIMLPIGAISTSAIAGEIVWFLCVFFPFCALQNGIMKVIMLSTLAGMPFFLLVAMLSASRKCKDRPEARKDLEQSAFSFAFLHSMCGVGLAVFGACMQYKYNAF